MTAVRKKIIYVYCKISIDIGLPCGILRVDEGSKHIKPKEKDDGIQNVLERQKN